MNKKIDFAIILSLIVTTLCACSLSMTDNNRKHASQKLQRLYRIEVYSAESDTLLNTIEDSKILTQFNALDSEVSDFFNNEEIKNVLKDATPLYRIVTYKSPAATNDTELEKLSTITIYKNTNIIMMEISENNIKSFSVPSEFLIFYENATAEKMEFLKSLASFSIDK